MKINKVKMIQMMNNASITIIGKSRNLNSIYNMEIELV
jgi:hypothetical protein